MRLFRCCCGWSFVIGRKRVYGAIFPMGIGDFPEALSKSQSMMSREYWEDAYADCWACFSGRHHHGRSS